MIQKDSYPYLNNTETGKSILPPSLKRVGVKLHWYIQKAFQVFAKIKFTPMKDLISQLSSSSSELAEDILQHNVGIFRR